MTDTPDPADPAPVSLTETEQDELNNRVVSGDADEAISTERAELARLGSYVLVEVDEDQHVEKLTDEQAAQARFEALKQEHTDPPES